jgi:excisionase family DNA binding protein
MTTRVIIPLPGIGTLELSREVYEAALRPLAAPTPAAVPSANLVDAKALAGVLSLPVSCIYEYAKAGRIPCVRAGKHVRFDVSLVRAALGAATVGHS